ncbi:DUF4406 domain-containing protein [Treponema sp. OMZ 788]|uniref:DUF4406 domain-containing protein n=1 Tax=Treponema sp. OMZ 788 TaxID=2563664 RepID=UPI0020A4A2AA|nr:DUF4406 domain-containing protein [Treponema sp. OMZ 788]UTC65231.1 DUF4406 domain-containing protein [Treponema sp. OMZ 788]
MIVYISGPITGVQNNNAGAFFKMEKELKKSFEKLPYLKIVNPQRLAKRVNAYFDDVSKVLNKKKKPKWEDYMRVCIAELAGCSHVVVLENYKKSKGVKVELFIARMLGIPVFFSLEDLKNNV